MASTEQKQIGTKFSALGVADYTGRRFYKLIVQEATTFTNLVELHRDGGTKELVGDTTRIPAAYSFFTGAELVPSEGCVFSRVNLASGSVIGYE